MVNAPSPKLFAVYLGGNAKGSNIELHDVQFVVGNTIEDTYDTLLDLWYGIPDGLHLDSYMPLEVVDGHRVTLSQEKQNTDNETGKRLYFINLGAYQPGVFGEAHANKFMVASDAPTVKARAKAELMQNWGSPVHKDDLFELDDCVEIAAPGWHIHLEPTDESETLDPVNGYHIVPKDVVAAYKARTA
jgi:hypothetical protein